MQPQSEKSTGPIFLFQFKNVKQYILVLILGTSFLASYGSAADRRTEILWDKYGVPHIYGKTSAEMYYAFGWAQMNNHANLMLKLYAQARGKAAEYFGKDYLDSDRKIILFDLHGLAASSYMQQDKEYKSYLDAFVQGINDYAKEHQKSIADSLRQVLPVSCLDVIAHTIRITNLEFLAAEDIYMATKSAEAGSNSIAIAPSKSASHKAMLVINPHLPWSDFFTWFEAHLNSEDFNAYGVALVGMPSLSMAFNNYLGWAHTVNPIDGSDRYELTLKDGGYLLDNKIVPFNRKVVTIKVKQTDGSLKEKSIEFKYSEHGPVVGEKGDKAWAVRIAGLNNTRIFEQYHKMAKAVTLTEFESALKMLQSPMFNVIYADKSGNILYLFNGNVPIRSRGDYAFWKGIVDGSDSKLIWNGTHAYEDLPRLLNPSSGFLQNCNDPPWSCTDPQALFPESYAAYMAPQYTMWRSQRAVNMIKDNPSISFDQLTDCKLNTGMEVADRFLDDLLSAVLKYPDTTALRAAGILRLWDKKTEVNSRGAVLFAEWWNMINGTMFKSPWDAKNPNKTPNGLKEEKKAVELLIRAVRITEQKYGSIDVPWGSVNRFRLNGQDYPGNGGSGDYGIFRTIYYADDADNKKHALAGDTFVAVAEFGDRVKAKVLLSYGNATQPGNMHSGDQLKMLSEKKLRPALLEKAEILNNLEKKETLNHIILPN